MKFVKFVKTTFLECFCYIEIPVIGKLPGVVEDRRFTSLPLLKAAMIRDFVHSSMPLHPASGAALFIAKQLLISLIREHGPPLLSNTWRGLKRLFGPCFPALTFLPTTGTTTNSTANTSGFTYRAVSSRFYRIYAAAVDSDNSVPVPAEVTSLEATPLASPDDSAVYIDIEADDLSV